jgi:hypothetical protein
MYVLIQTKSGGEDDRVDQQQTPAMPCLDRAGPRSTLLPGSTIGGAQCEPEEQSGRDAPAPCEARVDGDEASATMPAGWGGEWEAAMSTVKAVADAIEELLSDCRPHRWGECIAVASEHLDPTVDRLLKVLAGRDEAVQTDDGWAVPCPAP